LSCENVWIVIITSCVTGWISCLNNSGVTNSQTNNSGGGDVLVVPMESGGGGLRDKVTDSWELISGVLSICWVLDTVVGSGLTEIDHQSQLTGSGLE
jgi:hypothetical protein